MVVVGYRAGERIIAKGDEGDSMYIVRAGRVYARVKDDRGEPIKALMGRGEVFGEMSLLTGAPRNADVLADTDATVLVVPKPIFDELMALHSSFASYMTKTLGDRLTSRGGIRKVGKYSINGVLARGGMSIVYEGIHPNLDRPVAIKMLAHSLVHEEDFAKWFRREAQLIAKLRHPNIVEVFDWEEAYATTFIIMEKLEGTDIQQVLLARQRIPPAEVRDVVVDVAAALEYAHAQGVVHRDLKPSNIVVETDGSVKLTDFGVAFSHEFEDPSREVFIGTPNYASPEQALNVTVDQRSDIYALGVVTYEMLTGYPPFTAPSTMGILAKHVSDSPRPLRSLVADCPEDLARFVDRAMQKDPIDRYQSCTEILEELRPNQISEPMGSAVRRRNVVLVYTAEAEAEVDGFISLMKGMAKRIHGLEVQASGPASSQLNAVTRIANTVGPADTSPNRAGSSHSPLDDTEPSPGGVRVRPEDDPLTS